MVTKKHDDLFFTEHNQDIGERACINHERCLARFIAQVRYGPDTDKAFTCKEFLLPDQHAAFLAGKGLPARRGKCLLCLRYFINYTYILVRLRHSTYSLGSSITDVCSRGVLRAGAHGPAIPRR